MFIDATSYKHYILHMTDAQNKNDRKEVYKREEQFHDSEFLERKKISFLYSDGAISPVIHSAYEQMGDLKEKAVLEIGCGFGSHIVKIAKANAYVTGIDISQIRVNETLNQIQKENIQQHAKAMKMNAESLEFPNDSFDIVFGSSILHHLDLDIVLPEINRVLKFNGKAVFIEPLGTNPLINFYRKKTPNLRTADEHPFQEKDFSLFEKHFSSVGRENYFLFSLFSFIFRAVIRNETMFLISNRLLNKFDRVIMRLFPFLGRYCWQTVITLQKSPSEVDCKCRKNL